MEPVRGVYVQRAGLSLGEARDLLAATTLHGNLPEPLRLAHLIAGGIVTGKSRGRALARQRSRTPSNRDTVSRSVAVRRTAPIAKPVYDDPPPFVPQVRNACHRHSRPRT